jgi:hypothetical protein
MIYEKIRYHCIHFVKDRILYESLMAKKIHKGSKYYRFFYEHNNNITKFDYDYYTNKHDKLWRMLNE